MDECHLSNWHEVASSTSYILGANDPHYLPTTSFAMPKLDMFTNTVILVAVTYVTVSVVSAGEGEQCPICGAVYIYRNSLAAHMKSHDGQTRCSVCGQHFSTMPTLRRHLLMKHNMSRQEVDRVTNNRRALREAMHVQCAATKAGAESIPPHFPPPAGSHHSGDH